MVEHVPGGGLGLERWLSVEEHLLLLSRTWVRFQHQHGLSQPSITSIPGDQCPLLTSAGVLLITRHVCGAHNTHVGEAYT